MRRQVIFQSVSAPSKYGTPTSATYTNVLTTGGSITPVTNNQRLANGLDANVEYVNISVQNGPVASTITNQHEVLVGSVRYEITGVNTSALRSREIVFTVRRVG